VCRWRASRAWSVSATHHIEEARMFRITRISLLTTLISVVGLIVPLVALAGNGDPTGV